MGKQETPRHEYDSNGSSWETYQNEGKYRITYTYYTCTCGQGMGRKQTNRTYNG